jgi:ABC-type sugar transport system substrate-binding protein
MKSNKFLLTAAIFAVPMMLTAAAPPRFAWLANDPANTYDAATLAGIRDLVGLVRATVDPFYAGFDGPTQLAQCRAALASRLYDGLFIEAADAVGIEPCVAEAKQRNVPVVATDVPIGPDANNVQPQVANEVGATFIPGTRWGNAVKNVTPQVCQGLNPCNVLYIAGEISFGFDMLGIQGVQAAAAANTSIILIAVDQAGYDTATAKQVVIAQLHAHPVINVVIASGDQMALGVEQGAASLGRTLRIVGGGAGASAIAVKAGRWFGTFNALPRTEGQLGAGIMSAHLIDPRIKPFGLDPIAVSGLPDMWTPTTLAQHPNFVAQWPGPQ